MPRKPKVSYWPSRAAYGCWVRGEQHILAKGPKDEPAGPTYLAALDQFRQRLSLDQVGTAGDMNTLRDLCETYVRHATAKVKPGTIKIRVRMLRSFLDDHGELPVKKLTRFHLSEFIATKRERKYNPAARKVCGWSDGTARTFIDSLSRALNWAAKEGIITRNPISGIDRPPVKKRSAEVVLTDEQYQRILTASPAAQREFIVVLKSTGARPGEIVNVTAGDFDPTIKAIVYKGDDRRREDEFAHKTAYANRDRRIYLSGEALAIIQRLAAERPTGALFRTARGGKPGKPLTTQAVLDRFATLRKKLNLPNLSGYSFRHTYATRWIESGRSIELLAEALGNSPATILKAYSHLSAQHVSMWNHVAEFNEASSGAGSNGTTPTRDDASGG